MTLEDLPLQNPAGNAPGAVLAEMARIFAERGWLNQTLRILHGQRRYRVFCSEMEFLAYRINDHCGASGGFPGWPVCFVTPHAILEDGHLSGADSTEPDAREWLRCFSQSDFRILSSR